MELFTNKSPGKILKKLKKIFISNVVPIRPERNAEREKDKYPKLSFWLLI